MEKRIIQILKTLKLYYILPLIGAIVFIVMGEFDIFGSYAVEPNSNAEYICNSVAIVLTIIGLPGILKVFNLGTAHTLCRMDNDEALSRYLKYSLFRNISFAIIVVADIVVYYMTMNITGALCALSALVVSLTCWPKQEQITAYLERVNQDD